MRSLLLTLLIATLGCGDSTHSSQTDTSLQSVVTPADTLIEQGCSNADAIAGVLTIPEVVKKNEYLHSLSADDSINFITEFKTIEGIKYYKLSTGHFDKLAHFTNFFTFYVDRENCSHILALEEESGRVMPLEEWQDQQFEKAKPTWQQVATRPVNLPFLFNDYFSTCAHPYDSVKCADNYPSYPLENDPALKALVDTQIGEYADAYFILPTGEGVPAYVIAYTQFDINRYHLVTVADNKLVGNLKIEESGGDKFLYFEITEGNVVTLYVTREREQKGKFVSRYRVHTDGKIVAEK